jgi:hypothetical protein
LSRTGVDHAATAREDAQRCVACRHASAQVAAWLVARWAVAPRPAQDAAPAHDAMPHLLALSRALLFDLGDAPLELGQKGSA